MVLDQSSSKRKASGGRLRPYKKTVRKYECGRRPSLTKVGEKSAQSIRTLGGNKKNRLLAMDICNIFDPKTKKYTKAKIKSVVDCAANPNYIRRNIMVKGAVIETDK